MYPHQTERLTEILEREKLAALVTTSPANTAYLTAFQPAPPAAGRWPWAVFAPRGTALVLPAADAVGAIVDGADVDHVVAFGDSGVRAGGAGAGDARLARLLAEAAPEAGTALRRALEALDVTGGRVGVDESGLTGTTFSEIAASLGGLLAVPAAAFMREARRVKSPYEIDCIQRALGAAEEALNAVLQEMKPGMTEREAAHLYEVEVRRRDATPTRAVVAAGPRAWIPAPAPADRAIRNREVIRFDVGCVYKGYHGSVARTAVVGEAAPGVAERYDAVLAGLEAAIHAIRPGVPAASLHEAALAAARQAGLDGARAAAVGHGVGLEDCEAPALAPGADAELAMGEVLRVELADLEAGGTGLAVAETVLVTRLGSHVMNRSVRGLVVLD